MSRPYVLAPDGGLNQSGDLQCAVSGSSWMVRWSPTAAIIQWWNMPTQTLIGSSTGGDAFTGSVLNVDVATDGTVYYYGWYQSFPGAQPAFWTVPTLAPQTRVDSTGYAFAGPTRVFDLSGGRKVFTGYGLPSGAGHTGYLDLGVPVTDTQTAMDFALHGDGSAWGLFEPVGSSNQFTLKRLVGGALSYTVTGLVTRSATSSATFCHVAASKHFLVITDGKWYTINDDTAGSPGTIKASGSWPVTGSGELTNLPRKRPNNTTFWSAYTIISLDTVSVVSSVNPNDWLVEDATNHTMYDPISNGLVTHATGTTHVTWRLLGDVTGSPKTRAWGFILDGHGFYALRLPTMTLTFDESTSQWSRWQSGAASPLRAHIGMNWQGITKTTLNKGFADNVIAGDDTLGKLWIVDPTRSVDNDGSGGEVEFARQVIGAVPARGGETEQCGQVFLIGSVGNPALTGDTVTLETSDDNGNNWTSHGSLTVTAGNVSQELSWIGLGLISSPGRLFRITDSGALSRISSLDMDP